MPRPVAGFVASQVGTDPGALADYAGGTEGAGREHVAEIVRTLGSRSFDASVYRDLSRWLLPISEGTDSGEVLVGALFEETRRGEIVAPTLRGGTHDSG